MHSTGEGGGRGVCRLVKFTAHLLQHREPFQNQKVASPSAGPLCPGMVQTLPLWPQRSEVSFLEDFPGHTGHVLRAQSYGFIFSLHCKLTGSLVK